MSGGHDPGGGGDERFTEAVRADFLEAVADVVRRHVSARAAEIDATREFPRDICDRFAAMGLLGLSVPAEYDGAGAPLDLMVEIIAEVAAACANSANIITQQALGASAIALAGSEEQKRRWLPALASGEALGAFGLTEPEAGSDNRSMRTVARRDGDHYVVDGTKVFCTWGSIASTLTFFAQAEDDPDGSGVVALVVDLPADGVVVARIEQKMGLHGSPTAQLLFEGLRVPVEQRLGRPGDGLGIALRALDPGRVLIASLAVGIATGALGYAGRYLKERHQFGRPLADFQGLQFKLADHATQIEASRTLTLRAAAALDAGVPAAPRLAAMAKLLASDVAMATTTDAVGLLGGYGYLSEYPLERMMRDAKVLQIVEGTNEIQRMVIARDWLRTVG